MADIVLGVGASHTTLMNTQWERVDHLARAHEFRHALHSARLALRVADLDTVVIVGSNHFRGLWLDLMPVFTVGVGDVVAVGEHGTPSGPQPVDAVTAMHLVEHLARSGFDPAFSATLQIDHGISHAIQWLVPEGTPIVPIVVNCFAPPLMPLSRATQLGEALREAIAPLRHVGRVAVIGTGGLSHAVPFPDWRAPVGEDDEFLAESFRNGRGRWEEYEPRRRSIVVNGPARLNEAFDRDLLDHLATGTARAWVSGLADLDLVALAGNGANEIRAWLTMAAALDHRPARVLAYAPMPEWLTGMAVAVVETDHLTRRPS